MAVAVPFIPLILSAVGAGVQAYSAYSAGRAQQQQANYQAAVARNNAIIAKQYADAERVRGQRLEDVKRLDTAQTLSKARVAAAAGNIDVNSGSALRVQEDVAMLGESDALTIRSNAARAAYGYEVQGMNYSAQAELDNRRGNEAARAGQLNAFASLIGGASSVASRWDSFRTTSTGGI